MYLRIIPQKYMHGLVQMSPLRTGQYRSVNSQHLEGVNFRLRLQDENIKTRPKWLFILPLFLSQSLVQPIFHVTPRLANETLLN